MKNTNEMIAAVEETFKKAGCTLTEMQSAVLTSGLFVMFDAVRKDERELMLDIYSELIQICGLLAGHNIEITFDDGDISFIDIMSGIIKKQKGAGYDIQKRMD